MQTRAQSGWPMPSGCGWQCFSGLNRHFVAFCQNMGLAAVLVTNFSHDGCEVRIATAEHLRQTGMSVLFIFRDFQAENIEKTIDIIEKNYRCLVQGRAAHAFSEPVPAIAGTGISPVLIDTAFGLLLGGRVFGAPGLLRAGAPENRRFFHLDFSLRRIWFAAFI